MRSNRQKQRGPIIVQTQPQRRGPGLLGTMAQTAVIAGTATAVSKGVSGAMGGGGQPAAAQQAQINAAAQQAQLEAAQRAMAEEQAALAAQQAAAAPAAPTGLTDDKIAQLTKLADLQKAGILTDEEFAAQKAKILAS